MDSELAYLDYTVFLGMNAGEESVRLRCKAWFALRLERSVARSRQPTGPADGMLLMTWDHVGRCDDLIWRHSRELQDRYYPFMDALHSQPAWRREGYPESTLRLAAFDARLGELPVLQRMLVARALERQALVYTLDPDLLAQAHLPVRAPPEADREVAFPPWLETLYRRSLALRIPQLEPEVVSCITA